MVLRQRRRIHIRRSELSREIFCIAEQEATMGTSNIVEPIHLLAGIVTVSGPWLLSILDQAGVPAGIFPMLCEEVSSGGNGGPDGHC